MWRNINDIVWWVAEGMLLWVFIFGLIFAAALVLIVLVVRTSVDKSKGERGVQETQQGFIETPQYIAEIIALIGQLCDEDVRVNQMLKMLQEDREALVQRYFPGRFENSADTWALMISILDYFGYLAYYDWKDSVAYTLKRLASALEHYGIGQERFSDIAHRQDIIEPETSRMIAACLPQGYVLVHIDAGGDMYALVIVPCERAQRATEIAQGMQRPSYNTGLRALSSGI